MVHKKIIQEDYAGKTVVIDEDYVTRKVCPFPPLLIFSNAFFTDYIDEGQGSGPAQVYTLDYNCLSVKLATFFFWGVCDKWDVALSSVCSVLLCFSSEHMGDNAHYPPIVNGGPAYLTFFFFFAKKK